MTNRRLKATMIGDHFFNEVGVKVSTQTLRNRLKKVGMHARRPAKRLSLTLQDCRQRREPIEQEANCIFTN